MKLKQVIVVLAMIVIMGASASAGDQKFTQEELAYMPATAQIELFKAGVITPTDVLEAQIARVEKFNGECNTSRRDLLNELDTFNAGKVNSITFKNFEEARKMAKESEARYRNGTARPLEGVTVGIKDDHDVKGWRRDGGSLLAGKLGADFIRKEDDDVAERLRAAGAIFVFQTTVPEFCASCMTWSRLFGVTRNPWNLFYGVGGSSGGSGASLAAGFCTLATGTDMGGSTRIPSAMNGCYGFKPPFGRIPCVENTYCSCGPIARTFEDMVLMTNVLCGPSKRVQFSIRPKLEYPASYRPIKGEKVAVAYMKNWLKDGVDADVVAAMDRTVEALKRAGAEVIPVEITWTADALMPLYAKGLLASDAYTFVSLGNIGLDLMCTYSKGILAFADGLTPQSTVDAGKAITAMHQEVQEKVFDKGCIALIMPTLATAHVPADVDATPEKKADVNGKPYGGLSFCLTFQWNMMSAYPIVDVPAGISSRNVPIGVQVIANTYDDLEAYRVAASLSKTQPQLYKGGRFPDFRNAK